MRGKTANYEKAVAFWKALGKHEEAATYQRKLNGIKELQERIAAERADNLFSTFAFAVKIPFQDFMDDAAGHKHSGKIAEALQCCQGAFALLESERKNGIKRKTGWLWPSFTGNWRLRASPLATGFFRRNAPADPAKLKHALHKKRPFLSQQNAEMLPSP